MKERGTPNSPNLQKVRIEFRIPGINWKSFVPIGIGGISCQNISISMNQSDAIYSTVDLSAGAEKSFEMSVSQNFWWLYLI